MLRWRWREHMVTSRSVATMLPKLLHYQNYDAVQRPVEHTWSLAVEEHFYLAPSLRLWLLTNRPGDVKRALRPLPWIALSVMIFCLALRCFVNTWLPFTAHTHIVPVQFSLLLFPHLASIHKESGGKAKVVLEARVPSVQSL